MNPAQLTVKQVRARPVRLPLKRPIVSRVGLFRDWPLILIDLETNEGIVGRSDLEPYLERAARYLVPMIEDLAQAAGLPLAADLGGSIGPVPAYHSNGLWLTPFDTVGAEAEALVREGGFTALKPRRGRDRLADDIACIAAGLAARPACRCPRTCIPSSRRT